MEEQREIDAEVAAQLVEEERLGEEGGSGVLFRQGRDGRLEEVVEPEGKRDSSIFGEHTTWLDEGEQVEDEFADEHQQHVPSNLASTQPEQEPSFALRLDEPTEDSETSAEAESQDASQIWPNTTPHPRTHPLTKAGRFTTYPSTLQLPASTFTRPITSLLSRHPLKHLSERAHDLLGGPGLPYSPSTPRISRSMEQKPVALSAGQTGMREGEADVFAAAVMPQVYASVMSVLIETRKRLGGEWLRGLLKEREGGPLVLDVGGGGSGALAWRDVVRAEWESMGGKGPGPHGRATVVTGSEALRYRASRMLENTSFIPRLPDWVDPTEQQGDGHGEGKEGADALERQQEVEQGEGKMRRKQARKQYDIIIASHLLWPIKEDYMRKATVQTLWSLLNPNGGVLILVEKGVPRGFEVVAGARELLLSKHISSPDSTVFEAPLQDTKKSEKGRYVEKETGMIVAPCTNHTRCPLYKSAGVSKGRKDWCYFSQRYFRPDFLQKILEAKSRNYDDVEFSYLSVMRGRDHRLKEFDPKGKGFVQGELATERAADGYGSRFQQHVEEMEEGDELGVVRGHGGLEASLDTDEAEEKTDGADPHPLSLPRTILQPIKRKGHVLIDVCTPSGTIERWVVNRKCGKQAFRDARKAQWGDLWALGTTSRTERRVKLGRSEEEEKLANKRARKGRRGKRGTVEMLDDEDMRDVEDLES